MKYTLIKSNEEYLINYYDLDAPGFKIKNKNLVITFFNEDMAHKIVLRKYNKKIDNLYQIIMNMINDSDDDEGDYLLVLDDIDRLKMQAELSFRKYMTNEEYRIYIDKLYYLENSVNEKLALINFYQNMEYGERIGGRGR